MSNKKTLIAEHILPHEIDKLEQQLIHLEKSSQYLDSDDDVELFCVLNISPELVEFKSNDVKQTIIKQFTECIKYCDWANKSEFKIIDDNSILGCTDLRRYVARDYDKSITDIIFLDSDIAFHETLLSSLLESAKTIQNKYYVIVPQTVKLWDYTWDVLVNNNFLNENYGFYKTFDVSKILTQNIENIGLRETQSFKFAGGWFNLYSANLWRFVDVPNELGPYGGEDTYLMLAAEIMKNKNYDVQQYIIDGQIIAEDYIYTSPYKNDMIFKGKKELWKSNAESAFGILLSKFNSELKLNY